MPGFKPFSFSGNIGASKSIYNRALIVKSFRPEIELIGVKDSSDIDHLEEALEKLKIRAQDAKTIEINCGEGGTTLRFLAFRVSRLNGHFLLRISSRLRKRIPRDLITSLNSLGIKAHLKEKGFYIKGFDWNLSSEMNLEHSSKPIEIPQKKSSQFLSALVLNAWNLKFPLRIKISKNLASKAYFDLTLRVLEDFGLRYELNSKEIKISERQTPLPKNYEIEADMSSIFTVASLASVDGSCEIKNFPPQSRQPDSVFTKFFDEMGILYKREGKLFALSKADAFKGLNTDLKPYPDLFPVLACLLSKASTPSTLTGLENLVYKESNRLQKIQELFTQLGIRHEVISKNQGKWIALRIEAFHKVNPQKQEVVFDASGDHRLVMAASVLKRIGHPIRLKGMDAIKKSFKSLEPYL
jgi:3-phosphoshikimate 1-carboxyvinyltransferase